MADTERDIGGPHTIVACCTHNIEIFSADGRKAACLSAAQ